MISFTTPEVTRHNEHHIDNVDPDESSEIWATPCAIPPRSYSCSALKHSRFDSFMTDDNSDASSSDDVFLASPRTKTSKQLKLDSPAPSTGKLWTIVSNVIRLATRTDVHEELDALDPSYSGDSETDTKLSSTLARKAASFAGFLKNRLPGRQQHAPHRSNSSSGSEESSVVNQSGTKRKRANTIYTRPYETIGNAPTFRISSSPLAKRKRIQGRKPIERMRRNSSRNESGSDF